jgi:hypothetical protein
MRRFLNLLALLALSCAAVPALPAPQDDPVETRVYPIAFLTRPVPDRPGPRLGLVLDPVGTAVASASEQSALLPAETLVEILRANISPERWHEAGAKIESGEDTLTVTHRTSVHTKIRQVLDALQFAFGSLITIDAAIVSADPAVFARYRALHPGDRPAALLPEQARELLAAAREGKDARLLKSLRLTGRAGQRVHFHEGTQQSYLRDHDVQISSSAVALDPVVDVLTTGAGIELEAFLGPLGNLVTLVVRADMSDLETMDDRTLKLMGTVPAPGQDAKAADAAKAVVQVPGEARVQLPRVTHEWLRTSLTARHGETLIVGTTLKKGRVLAFLITPTVNGLGFAPAPDPVLEGERILRMYDLASLTRGIQDYQSPSTELVSPQRGGGGPLTGATFTLDEPRVGMGMETLLDLVKAHVAPESWENRQNSISQEAGHLLVVRQTPAVQKDIERYLHGISLGRSASITTQAVAIAFRKGALAEWEQSIPALLPGGYFAEEAEVSKLLEEAAKGDRLRIAGLAEITGCPQQRVHVAGTLEESYIQEFEPQVSTNSAQFDPIMGVLVTGSVLDVRPAFMDGPDRIQVDLRASLTSREMKEIETASSGVGPLQVPRITGARWQTDLVSTKGRWTLVGLESRGEGDAREDLALFVRARANLLK